MVNRAQRVAIADETIRCYNDMREHFPQMGTTSILHTCEEMATTVMNDEQRQHQVTRFEVCDVDTIRCARNLLSEGLNPLVLNFASDFQPGGGWRKGSSAQEEDLFFKTTYGLSLDFNFNPATRPFYPLLSTACIYSSDVYVFRDDTYKMLEYEACYPVNFVACAAIRQPELIAGKYWSKCSMEMVRNLRCGKLRARKANAYMFDKHGTDTERVSQLIMVNSLG